MANLYRPKITRYEHPATGERCSKSTPGAIAKQTQSKTWRAKYRDGDNILRTVSLGTSSKAAAQLKLSELMRDAESGDQYRKHSRRPLSEHLEDYRKHLAGKANTGRYVSETCGRIAAIIDGCGFRWLKDVSASDVAGWLADRRAAGQFGSTTSNHHLRAIKSFCGWLVKDRRTGTNHLQHLSGLNARGDVRRERRHLEQEDFNRLIAAAEAGGVAFSLTGQQRAMLYRVASMTGLRSAELGSLTAESFDFAADPPTVTVEAGYSKRRRKDVLPLSKDIAMRLQEWLQELQGDEPEGSIIPMTGKPTTGRLWPGRWADGRHGADMLRKDLKTAGIPYRDSAGRVFDFHSLRHQFISTLAAAGIHPRTAQELARHSNINLTMTHYTHLRFQDLAAAVDLLPPANTAPQAKANRSGG